MESQSNQLDQSSQLDQSHVDQPEQVQFKLYLFQYMYTQGNASDVISASPIEPSPPTASPITSSPSLSGEQRPAG